VNEMSIQSVAFGPNHVEIAYLESRDIEGPIQEFRTLVVPLDLVEDQMGEVFDALQQLVDHILVLRRNPPERLQRAR
jgi:hypothetical protein